MIWTCGKKTSRRQWQGTVGPLIALLLTGCRPTAPLADVVPVATPMPAPASPALYTAVGAIRALASGPDGALWAATAGGVVCWKPGEPPVRWTAADGLAGSDVRAVAPSGAGAWAATETRLCGLERPGSVSDEAAPTGEELRCLLTDQNGPQWLGTNRGIYVQTGSGRRRFPDETWRMASDGRQEWAITSGGLRRLGDGRLFPLPVAREELGPVTALAAGPEGVFLATALGLWQWSGGRWRALPLPPGSPASHVSALGVRAGALYAGLYGDGVYRWESGSWRRLAGQPPALAAVTALAPTPDGLAAGTRAAGVWDWTGGGVWKARALPDAVPSGDIYALAGYRGALWASTFDSGLLRLDGRGQGAVTRADGLAADAPRALVVFGSSLYVRHTTGQVDRTDDGRTWHPAFTRRDLPRPLTSALATDGSRLLVGGWAGWSAWDGQTWEHHDKDPELAGQVVTAIAARAGEVWIGTQKQGLFRYAQGRYTHLFEAQGLTDDWITCLSVTPARVLVGTYTGGLLEWDGARLAVRFRPEKYAVRAVGLPPGGGHALAATPLGVYEEGAAGWTRLDPHLCGGAETQALLATPSGLWIGSRTGLAYWPGGGHSLASDHALGVE